jgi:hypothetical protein
MNNLSNEQIYNKWTPLIEQVTKIKDKEHLKKVSAFAHNFAMEEAARPICDGPSSGMGMAQPITAQRMRIEINKRDEYTPSLLPINLQVIAKIKDLSKVVFMNAPRIEESNPKVEENELGEKVLRLNSKTITADNHSYKLIIDHSISEGHGFHWLNEVENHIIEEVANKINQSIENGNTLYIYQPVSVIQTVRSAIPYDNNQEIRFQSRMKEMNKNGVSMDDI